MDKHELAVQRAEEASRILNSAIFTAAFDDTRQALLNGIASLDSMKSDRAQELHSMVKGLDSVKRCLEVHIDTGKLARVEIEHRSKIAQLNPFKRRA